jgi:two-component system chemotaxis sensor kinase CheA
VALPLDAVREARFVPARSVARGADGTVISHGGRLVPFVPLGAILRRPGPPRDPGEAWSAVLVESDGAVVAVGADRVAGTSELVVRAIPAFAQVEATIAGAALDGEGNPRIVLDPAAVVAMAGELRAPGEAGTVPQRRPILVVDDSLTTRMLEESILQSAGYEVDLAVSGEEALEKARLRPYGLFLVDVEMPGIDGFEFVRAARADPRLSAIPAILVTSRSAPEDRQRGVEVGASAYVVKSEFDQRGLLAKIAELLG